jgi:homocysteine S-methyltransferase
MADAFREALDRAQPLILDGGLATQLEAQGCDLGNALWSASLLIENPRAIVDANRAFLDAGAECIASASYQASREGFALRGLSADESDELMLRSVELAIRARDEFVAATSRDFVPLVAASLGPYGAVLHDGSEYRGDYTITADDLRRFHEARLRLFDASGADVLAFETVPSLPEAEVLADLLLHCKTPAWVSFSCKDDAHISDGSPIETAVALFRDHPVVEAIGINCTPPQFATALIRRIREVVPDKAIMAYPNSGETYDAKTSSWFGTAEPVDYAAAAREWHAAGAKVIGGCCRTGPAHIAAIREALLTGT